jgi:hypothetical protein
VFRDRPPILGRTAQAAREAAVARRAEVAALLAAAESRRILLQGGLRVLAALADAGTPSAIEAQARALADAAGRLASIKQQLAAIEEDQDGPGAAIRGRIERIAANRGERDSLDRRVKEAYGTLGGLERDLAGKEGRAATLLAHEQELSSAQKAAVKRG